MSWRPWLEGADAPAARAAIDAIARDLEASDRDASRRTSLAQEALFFGYRSLDRGRAEDLRACAERIDRTREQLPQTGWLFGGLAEVGWIVSHLQGLGVLAGHDDLLEAIDAAIEADLEEPPTEGFDLILGTAGTGLYALERWPAERARSILERAIEQLLGQSERVGDGVSWRTPLAHIPPTKPQVASGYFDVGVAHGSPGVLPLLAGAARRGVQVAPARAALDGLVRWLDAQQLGGQPTLPAFVGEGLEPQPGRLAWCYGDAGVAGVLWAASEPGSEERQLADRLTQASAARPLEHSGVVDPSVCHGSAGLAHLFARLGQGGDEPAAGPVIEAARLWYRQTLARRGHEGVGGYTFFQGGDEPGFAPERGLLVGSVGVGLTLLAGVATAEPGWDRLLGLSLRDD